MSKEVWEWLEADRSRYVALPWPRRLAEDAAWWLQHGIRNAYSDLAFSVRVRLNRAIHDYDELDWWEYYSQSSRRAVNLLTLLRDRGHGYPGSLCPCESHCSCDSNVKVAEWHSILDDMIFFHQVCAGDVTSKFNLSQSEKERFEKGRQSYANYYEALWD